ncbi:MAG: FAD:protein FMN transferase [Acidimicrobiia bacterium]
MDHLSERHARAMGSDVHIVVVGGAGDDLIELALARIAVLEARWSRFRPDSELSRINAADGNPVVVSTDTLTLVEGLRSAWERTDGRFDPTVYDAMNALGYDRTFAEIGDRDGLPHGETDDPYGLRTYAQASVPTAGCWGVELRHDRSMVQLPQGVHLDPGGLGKGLAADLVARELFEAGADGVLVSIGGDLRVMGASPGASDGESTWRIGIEHPTDRSRSIGVITLADGGIATSTSSRRRWTTDDGVPRHHLIDPSTGLPAERTWTQVTAVAGTAAWAEVAAKAIFLDGCTCDCYSSALVVDADDRLWTIGDPSWFTCNTPLETRTQGALT